MPRVAKSVLTKIIKKNEKKEVNSITIKLIGDAKFIDDMKYIMDNSKSILGLGNDVVLSDLLVNSIKNIVAQCADEMRNYNSNEPQSNVNEGVNNANVND